MGSNSGVFKGSTLETGIIDFCSGCKQRAELQGNGLCGDCNKEQEFEDNDPRKKLPTRVDPQKYLVKKDNPVQQFEGNIDNNEKSKYLEIILGASQSLIDEVVKDIYEKRILHYDFNQVVQNERWFSLMDLRRMALKINPEMEKSETEEGVKMDDKKLTKRRKK